MEIVAEPTVLGGIVTTVSVLTAATMKLADIGWSKYQNGNGKVRQLPWSEKTCNERHDMISKTLESLWRKMDSARHRQEEQAEKIQAWQMDVVGELATASTESKQLREEIKELRKAIQNGHRK